MKNKKYYHGTSLLNVLSICKLKSICSDYNGCYGCYITDNFLTALNFGECIFEFDEKELDKSLFEIDDVNDGIFYKGGIKLINNINIIQSFDKRGLKNTNKKAFFYYLSKCVKFMKITILNGQIIKGEIYKPQIPQYENI